ncbi:hypothetical protein RVR_4701 [Actinacidiphila reveromycinica]|uniref:DUF2252 domain-containing protein n=1 Tax=Actinacidiphila reveromycinica TaxID=659352 RepID=A0A7U3VP91_9ACTN|nr:DUF2252 domain-containing protein [Streptomyces sp. SN-593]BBA98502.1 hypothetical protein RVR_4701 [Streptomyces sp. SN-593]
MEATDAGIVTVGGAAMRSPEERARQGKAARARAPRSAHAQFAPPAERTDPVDTVERQSATRLPELVPLRYGRMLESPFRFYRGAAAVMAEDLSRTPVSGFRTQLCGDAHLMNFRLLASAERNLLFDLNDFDETLPGPWEWDVKRLAASMVIAARENGFTGAEARGIVRATVRSYREQMRRFAGMRDLDVWYARADADLLRKLAAGRLQARGRRKLSAELAKARGRDSLQAARKLTEVVDGRQRIVSDPPVLTRLDDLLPGADARQVEELLRGLLTGYQRSLAPDRQHLLEQFGVVDMARKVVGVGSVGTRCWIVLLVGRDRGDPLFLQAKEATASVLAPYAGASRYDIQGRRVVAGQRLMQSAGDIFLGWERTHGLDGVRRDFYVRQLRDWKGVVDPSRMVPRGMRVFGELCGATLARAHARSGDRIAIAAYLGSGDVFDRALAAFAESYADQNERDHAALAAAAGSGRVKAAQA